MDSLLELLNNDDSVSNDIQRMFVTLILPVPLPKLYTYSVPLHLRDYIQRGIRVEVPFGKNKLYAGLVYEVHYQSPSSYDAKPILSVLDDQPLVTDKQFTLWKWLADYYVCTLGEVMIAAMPAGLKLGSETKISLREDYEEQDVFLRNLNTRESFIVEYLVKHSEITIENVQKLIKQKTVQPIIKGLFEKKIIEIKEELENKYKPKRIRLVRLTDFYQENPSALSDAFTLLGRAERQMEALMAYIQISKIKTEITCKEIYEKANVDSSVLNKIQEKGIFQLYEKEISRLGTYDEEGIGNYPLSDLQRGSLDSINEQFKEKNVILLHGVTGSGKTQVFVELMEQVLQTGRQVLYLLPEIALTAQIVGRLQKHFGDKIIVYHSKFNSGERVEVWQAALRGTPIILGARSALFLPFQDLGLIIVDEEHDPSYKQADPSPRYNARDTAVYLSYLYNAKTLLGTATPSLETYHNVQQKKYGLVEMKYRFGGLSLPEMWLVDVSEETRAKRMKSHFTPQLLEALNKCLNNGEQAILFQNRRGYAPVYKCQTCGWTSECIRCDVALTYHKHSNDLHCHYCGHQQKTPKACHACGSVALGIQGFGTEKIEDELQIYLPDVRVVRMDLDTVRGKHGADTIVQKFEKKEVDILVGTQMVTKGLDFDNVGLVGVLSADQMLQFPDFRASERAYQLLTQVAGRAGRKKKQGKVIVQAFQVTHPVLSEIRQNDFDQFLARELKERSEFGYPPFMRLIKIQLKHKKDSVVVAASKFFAEKLKAKLGDKVLGPAVPGVARIREYYMMDIMIKLPKSGELIQFTKNLLLEVQNELKQQQGMSSVRILIDVDPY